MTKQEKIEAQKALAEYWGGSVSASVARSVASAKTNHSSGERKSASLLLAQLEAGNVR